MIGERAALARHECGHALAYLRFGVPFTRVSIDPYFIRTVSGHRKRVEGGVDGELRCPPWVGAVILYAGPAAQGSYEGARNDLQLIDILDPAWLEDRGPSSPWAAARRLVDAERQVIEEVAARLVRAGEMGAEEFAAAVGPGQAGRRWWPGTHVDGPDGTDRDSPGLGTHEGWLVGVRTATGGWVFDETGGAELGTRVARGAGQPPRQTVPGGPPASSAQGSGV